MSSTLNFRELTLRNFISFGQNETVIDLSVPGTTSIEGQNLDVGGTNAVGKTGIINAICYALYNKPFDDISLQRLINRTNATKSTLMEVRLSFERAGDEYEVHRARGEQYTIHIWKNGIDITPGKGVTECDKLILDVIGISYELFTKTIILSGNASAFLQLPIGLQRTQIEELFNITLLSEKGAKQRELIRVGTLDLKVQEAIVKQQGIALELHQKHVQDAQARVEAWNRTRIIDVKNIEKTLASINNVDFELEQLLHDEKAKLLKEGVNLSAKLVPVKRDKTQLSLEIKQLLKEKLHLTEANCPYCLQQFADASLKLAGLEDNLIECISKLEGTEVLINELTVLLENQQTELTEVQDSIQCPNLNELLLARENASVLRSKLVELELAVNPHIEAVNRLNSEPAQPVDTDKVDALRRRLEHQAFLLKLLMNKDSFLRRRIISKTIPFLNSRINHYTSALGLPHIVKFDADLSCSVSEFGRELDFGNLSAGEKKRVNTGMSLSFRDVLHRQHAKTNLLLIDELDGALDSVGIDAVIRILKDKSRDEALSVYVISHSANVVGRLDRTMTIIKQNGFSTISES